MTQAADQKRALRRRLREARGAVAPGARAAASRRICALLAASEVPRRAAPAGIGVFLPTEWEVDLRPLYARWRDAGLQLLLPAWAACAAAYRPALYPQRDAELVPGRWGILEPRSPTWIPGEAVGLWLAPGLAFDREGFRLGHGGGAFDRLLSGSPGAVICGVAFSWQVVDLLPREPHDVRMHFIITEEGAWRSGRFEWD